MKNYRLIETLLNDFKNGVLGYSVVIEEIEALFKEQKEEHKQELKNQSDHFATLLVEHKQELEAVDNRWKANEEWRDKYFELLNNE